VTYQQISKIWTVVSLFLLYYALNTYLVVQGGAAIFGATLIVSNRVPAAMVGIPICSLLLILASLVGIDHSGKTGPGWSDRIPLVGFDSIDPSTREAKIYQGAMLFLFSVLPIVSIIHFWTVIWSANLVTTKNPPEPIASIWSWGKLVSFNDPARICTFYHQEPAVSCEGNVTILPGLEPTLFALLTLLAFGTVVCFWRTVFREPPLTPMGNDY
jgi:hypothetical protein